jgi:hypothetical protein
VLYIFIFYLFFTLGTPGTTGVPIKWMCVEGTKDEGMLNVVTALIRACSNVYFFYVITALTRWEDK